MLVETVLVIFVQVGDPLYILLFVKQLNVLLFSILSVCDIDTENLIGTEIAKPYTLNMCYI